MKLDPRLPIAATSATPIISPDAVDAVRSRVGARALSAAMRPSIGVSLRSGQAIPRTIARNDDRADHDHAGEEEDARRTRRPAMTGERGVRVDEASVKTPSEAERRRARRRPRAGGPSCSGSLRCSTSTASIGGTRPARIAGRSAPSSVATMPRIGATMKAYGGILDRADREADVGDHLDHQLGEQQADQDTEQREPSSPSSIASSRIIRTIIPARRAERAQHADLAHALCDGHVERVEDQEAADEQRHRGEEVEHDVEALELELMSSPMSTGCCTFDALVDQRFELACERRRCCAPSSTATPISSSRPGCRRALRRLRSASWRSPGRRSSTPPPNWNEPDDLELAHAGRGGEVDACRRPRASLRSAQ